MNARSRAELYLLSVTLIWGSTFALSKYLLDTISPLVYIGVRFTAALLVFTLLVPRRVFQTSADTFVKGAILGVLLFAGFVTQTIGLQYTGASKSAFITGMMVVFTPICQIAIERRMPKLGNVLGILAVTVGLYLLTSPSGSEFNLGDGLNLICAVTFGLYIVYMDVFSKERDAVQLTAAQFVVCAVLGLAGAVFFEPIRFHPTPGAIGALVYLTIFATVIALFVQTRYQRDTTPTRSAVIFSIEPVLASLFAYFLLGEVLGTSGMVGGGFIVAGVLISELSPS
jgi:drug/metabolite transporter (DMT)-like permease